MIYSILLLFLLLPLRLSAQTEIAPDSLPLMRFGTYLIPPATKPASADTLLPIPALPWSLQRDSVVVMPHIILPRYPAGLPYYTDPSAMFWGDYLTHGRLFRYRYGLVSGFGRQYTLPGIGRINESGIRMYHELNDRLILLGNLTATQLNMEFFHGHALTLDAALHYQLNDQMTLKLFGSYDTGNPYDLYGRQFGGTLDWQMTNRFGIEGGVRRNYDPLTGRWQTLPVVMPYYNFDHFQMKLDVGPILFQILEGVIQKNRSSHRGPTIAPPRGGLR